MALRSQKQVMAGLDLLAGRAVRKAAPAIKAETTDRLVKQVRGVKETGNDKADFARMEKALGVKLLKGMGTEASVESVAEMATQAALVGRITATPKEDGSPQRRRDTEPEAKG